MEAKINIGQTIKIVKKGDKFEGQQITLTEKDIFFDKGLNLMKYRFKRGYWYLQGEVEVVN